MRVSEGREYSCPSEQNQNEAYSIMCGSGVARLCGVTLSL